MFEWHSYYNSADSRILFRDSEELGHNVAVFFIKSYMIKTEPTLEHNHIL